MEIQSPGFPPVARDLPPPWAPEGPLRVYTMQHGGEERPAELGPGWEGTGRGSDFYPAWPTSSHGEMRPTTSVRCPMVDSSSKSRGKVSVHSASNWSNLAPNFRTRACKAKQRAGAAWRAGVSLSPSGLCALRPGYTICPCSSCGKPQAICALQQGENRGGWGVAGLRSHTGQDGSEAGTYFKVRSISFLPPTAPLASPSPRVRVS